MTNDDLQHQLDAAVAAMRELDDDRAAGRISAADHAELKQRSERQAAVLLKRLRQQDAEAASHTATPPGGSGAHVSARRPIGARLHGPVAMTLGGVLLVVLGVAVGVVLGRASSDVNASDARGESTNGVASRSASDARGEAPAASPAGAAQPSAELAAIAREVERDDAPTTRLLAFAHLALDQGQLPAAITAYKRVLAREPKNVEAITHIGVILYQGDHVDAALARIDEAIRIDPRYGHAQWDRAQILFNARKDYAGAIGAIDAFLAVNPTGADAERARSMLSEARRQIKAGP